MNSNTTFLRNNQIIGGVYRVMYPIGAGGTGTVYLGYHMHLRKYVVLKRLNAGLGNEKFLRAETDILKNLHHPYLPQVYDFLVHEGSVYTVIDYVEGYDLTKYKCGIAELPEKYIVQWLSQMAEVLSYLHTHKPPVIHSDIKPGNVIITPDNNVCLIDFNISLSSGVTEKVSGLSYHFASPEQCYLVQEQMKGNAPSIALDVRTDIYSTGALFYKLMTGTDPAGGAVMPTLKSLGNTGYSEGLCEVIDRCMEWDRNRRYKDGQALHKAVLSIRKREKGYRRYVALRAASWILSAALIGGGSYCLLHGFRTARIDSYQEVYAETMAGMDSRDPAVTEQKILAILNNADYQGIFEDNPMDRAALAQTLGDLYFEREDYAGAEMYYEAALQSVEKAGEDPAACYRNYIVVLCMRGQEEKARSVLIQAERKNIDPQMLLLMRAGIEMCGGNTEECLASISQLLEGTTDPATRGTAASIAAEACRKAGRTEEQIQWLTSAVEFEPKAVHRRNLGAACIAFALQKAEGNRNGAAVFTKGTEAYQLAEKAEEQYRILSRTPFPYLEDMLNDGIILQYMGRDTESLDALQKCKELYPDRFEVLMYIAFACENLGQEDNAVRYAKAALEAYAKSGSPILEETEAQALRRLERMADR